MGSISIGELFCCCVLFKFHCLEVPVASAVHEKLDEKRLEIQNNSRYAQLLSSCSEPDRPFLLLQMDLPYICDWEINCILRCLPFLYNSCPATLFSFLWETSCPPSTIFIVEYLKCLIYKLSSLPNFIISCRDF